MAAAVEAHSFEALDQLCWRNSDLDLSHVDALLATLMEPPPGPGLVKGNDAADLETLRRTGARARDTPPRPGAAAGPPAVGSRSDTRLPQAHGRYAHQAVRPGLRGYARAISTCRPRLAGQIGALSRSDGDIDTLMQRLAGVRIWSYIAARGDWVKDSPHWQGQAREVEDLLSDALHERLTSRSSTAVPRT